MQRSQGIIEEAKVPELHSRRHALVSDLPTAKQEMRAVYSKSYERPSDGFIFFSVYGGLDEMTEL